MGGPLTKWECSSFSPAAARLPAAHKGPLSLTRRLFFLRVEWPGLHSAVQEG